MLLNCAKEYGLIALGLVSFLIACLVLLPIIVVIFFWYILLAIVHRDFSYIDEEM